jgi:RimJ/RimL family protein N-acetyltransferase
VVHVIPLDVPGVGSAHRPGVLTLADGRRIAVRSLDRSALIPFGAFVRRLSANSRALRFLASIRSLSDNALRRLVLVDQCSHVAWIGEAREAPGTIIAEARYALTAPAEAELAFAVADDWQCSGVGTDLLCGLLMHAAATGIERVWGYVRRDNNAALTLAKRYGFKVRPAPDEAALLIVSRSLAGFSSSRTDRGPPRRPKPSEFTWPWKFRSLWAGRMNSAPGELTARSGCEIACDLEQRHSRPWIRQWLHP